MDFNAFLPHILPYILVALGGFLLACVIGYLLFQRVTQKREASRLASLKSRWRESREEFIESRRDEVRDAVQRVLSMIDVDVVLLGNALWKSPGFHHHVKTIADICQGAGVPFRIPKEQFDRLFQGTEDAGSPRQGGSTESILRILEELQREGLFELECTKEVSMSQDPDISMEELWEHFKSESKDVLVITADRKLRIQIRNDIQREQRTRCRLVEPQEIRELLSRCSGAVHLAFDQEKDGSPSASPVNGEEPSKMGAASALYRAI